MSETYKLVFRGELLEGQHPAVVRSRLAKSGSFAEAELDKLFSGRPVVIKRAADTATAARLQVLFKNAGARLRVLPVDAADQADAAQPSAEARDDAALELLPPGSEVLRQDERATVAEREVDTSGLSLSAEVHLLEPPPAPPAPDVTHLTLAQAGVDLTPHRAPAAPVVDFAELSFEVLPAGELLGQAEHPPVPAAPDTSHLKLEDFEDFEDKG